MSVILSRVSHFRGGRSLPAFLLLLLVSTASLFAQGDTNEFDDFEFNLDSIPVMAPPPPLYTGFGAGPIIGYTMINADGLNNIRGKFGFEDAGEFGSGIISYGGNFFLGGIGPKNFRFGFSGAGGSIELEEAATLNGVEYDRQLRYTTSYMAGQLDYAIYLSGNSLILFPGVLLGQETSRIEYSQIEANSLNFDSILSPSTANAYVNLQKNSFYIRPMVNLEYIFNMFLSARIGAGYGLNLGGTWSHNAGPGISNVPDDIKSDGPVFSAGLFVGLFQ